MEDFEVIVVDDASTELVNLPEDPRLRVIRLSVNSGGAVARNVGARAARGKWLTYLDDDDQLLPHMAAVSLEALAKTTLPQPVALISGIEVVNEDGQTIQKRIPPTLPRGSHFGLEEIEPGQSFFCKQTMVVERQVLLGIGGFDESFQSRIHTELFLRLNLVCSIVGLSVLTYRLYEHSGSRVTRNLMVRQVSSNRLVRKHELVFSAHPKKFAKLLFRDGLQSYELGLKGAALSSLLWSMRLDPFSTLRQIVSFVKRKPRELVSWYRKS